MIKIIVTIPKGRKDHIAELYPNGTAQTMCGKSVPEGSTIIEHAPRLDLCKACLIWLGKEMESEFMGLNFYKHPYKTSIIKHRKRST